METSEKTEKQDLFVISSSIGIALQKNYRSDREGAFFNRVAFVCFEKDYNVGYYLRFGNNVLNKEDCYDIVRIESNAIIMKHRKSDKLIKVLFKDYIDSFDKKELVKKYKFIKTEVYIEPPQYLSGEMLDTLSPFRCVEIPKLQIGQKVVLNFIDYPRKFKSPIINGWVIHYNFWEDSLLIELEGINKAILVVSDSKVRSTYENLYAGTRSEMGYLMKKKKEVNISI